MNFGPESSRPEGTTRSFAGWLKRWSKSHGQRREAEIKRRREAETTLQLESLEVRDLMSINAPPDEFLPVEPTPVAIELVNIAGGMHDDLLSLGTNGKLTVAVNDGAGKWASVHSVETGVANAQGMAVGLFDGDGFLDVVVQGSDSLVLLVGNGAGGFSVSETILPGTAGSFSSAGVRVGAAVGLLAGDLRSDLVVLQPGADAVHVFRTAGDGKLSTAAVSTHATGADDPIDVVVGNFVGDALPDLAIGHRDGTVTFLAGASDGSFSLVSDATVSGLGEIVDLAAADLDADGDLDLVVTATDRVTVLSQDNDVLVATPVANGDFAQGLTGWTATANVNALGGAAQLHEGSGLLTSLSQTFVVPPQPQTLSFDILSLSLEAPGGGLPDAFEASLLDSAGNSLVPTFRPDATSFFNANPGGQLAWGAGTTYDAATGRVTLDISALAVGTTVTLYFDLVGNLPGAGSSVTLDRVRVTPEAVRTNRFTTEATLTGLTRASGAAIGDVDGNGRPNIVVADAGAGKLVVFDRTPSGSYDRSEHSLQPIGATTTAVAIGNLTAGDGIADVAVGLADTNRVATPLGNGFDLVAPTASLLTPAANGSSSEPVQQIVLQFDEAMFAGPGLASVTNPAGYRVVGAGANGLFGDGDDTTATVTSVAYDTATHRATLVLNGGTNPLGAGKHRVSLVGTQAPQDLAGNAAEAFTANFTILPPPDSTPPTVSLAFTPDRLWPPNHKLVDITATLQIGDDTDAAPRVELVSIVSNEGDNCDGDGNTSNDIQGASIGTDDRHFKLRAERSGGGDGRVYTITYRVTDAAGNVTLVAGTVRVAHDQGQEDDDDEDQEPIRPLETARFVTVDDDEDRAYGYGANGEDRGSAALAAGNTKARGVAASPDGNTRWVIDANKKIYVYDRLGALLGSWTANGLHKPEDITVVGNDVYIVDAGAKKVFRYAGATSRISGSQNAATSFSLNSQNKDATGIVSDGTRIWVTDDGRNSIFVYNMSGAKLGEWKLASANGNARGITLSPTGGTDLWTVDGDDGKVYRYADGRTRLNGTGTIASSFDLDDDNEHAEGIADPPVNQVSFGQVFGGTAPAEEGVFEEWFFEATSADELAYVEGLLGQFEIYFIVRDADGNYVGSDSSPAYRGIALAGAGTYRLEVFSGTGAAVNYQLKLRSADTTVGANLSLGSTASGTLAGPGDEIRYTVNSTEYVPFAFVPNVADPDVQWELRDEFGGYVDGGDFAVRGRIVPQATGTYTLDVWSRKTASVSFGFALTAPVPEPIERNVNYTGDFNGTFDPPFSYAFEAAAGETLLLAGGSNPGMGWALRDEAGNTLFREGLGPRVWTFAEGGVYTLSVEFWSYEIGSGYGFSLRPLVAVPAEPGAVYESALDFEVGVDAYALTIGPNGGLNFDWLTETQFTTHVVSLVQVATNAVIFYETSYDRTTGPLSPGEYVLLIAGYSGSNSDPYSFSYTLTPGEAVPAVPLAFDVLTQGSVGTSTPQVSYEFSAAAGDRVFLDALSNSFGVQWTLREPSGQAIFYGNFSDRGPLLLVEGGTYRLDLFSQGSGTQNYSFRLLSVPAPSVTAVEFGERVQTSIVPGQVREFTIEAAAGTRLVLDAISAANNLGYTLRSPSGEVVFAREDEDREVLLTEGGTWTLTIVPSSPSRIDAAGTVDFRLLRRAAVEPMLLNSTVLDDGTGGWIRRFAFQGTAGDEWVLDREGGTEFVLRGPSGSGTSTFNGDPYAVTATGEYVVEFAPSYDSTPVRFRVQQTASPTMGALDTLGTRFWTAFPQNGRWFESPTPRSLLFVSAERATSGTIQVPGLDWSTTFVVGAGETVRIELPEAVHTGLFDTDTIRAAAVLVTALDEVSVSALSLSPRSSGGYSVLPDDVLGTEYLVMAYENRIPFLTSTEFAVVATENDTTVTIVPTGPIESRPAGTPYTIVLQRGEMYHAANILGDRVDLTGTLIQSDKPIAVIGGHGATYIPEGAGFADHVVEQMTPVETWGRRFVAVPFAEQSGTQMYRVLASADGTAVRVNGTEVALLDRGAFWEGYIAGPVDIEASAPVLVAQFSLALLYPGTTTGDPGMVLLPPVEQWLPAYGFSTPTEGFPFNHANVTVRAAGVGTLLLDGVEIPAESFVRIGDSDWWGATVPLTIGAHRLSGAEPFGLIVYGFNEADSYLYPGGLSLAPLALVTNVALAPHVSTLPPGAEHLLTATATDASGNPVAGVRVDFVVTGANTRQGFAFTDALGRAVFAYRGDQPGEDVVTASIGPRTATASVLWEASAATIELTSPLDGSHLPAGPVVLSGRAVAGGPLGRIVLVTVDGRAVDVLDSAGGFFARVDLPEGECDFMLVALDSAGNTAELTVTLTGTAVAEGGDVTQLDNVTSLGEIAYANVSYNRRTGTLLADLRLTNASPDPLDGPVLARFDRIGPGGVVLASAEGTDAGRPYVVFDTELSAAGLAAGATATLPLAFVAAPTERFSVDVSLLMQGNRAPAFRSVPAVEAVVGRAYSYAPEVIDPDGSRLEFRLDQAPEGLTVDGAGRLSWVPIASQVGLHEVELVARDGRGGEARQRFRIAVELVASNRPPVFESVPPTQLASGGDFAYQPIVRDADGDAIAYVLSAAPAGTTLDPATGRIFLSTPADGNHAFVLRVDDGHGGSAEQAFVVTVGSGAPAAGTPRILSTPPRTAVAGQLYVYQVEAVDPQGSPLSYTLIQAPAGAAFDPLHPGRLVWNPTVAQAGPQTIEIKVDDGLGGFATQAFSVNVLTAATNRAPIFTSTPGVLATQGETYSYEMAALDPEGDAVSYRVLTAPVGMQLVDGRRLVYTPGGADVGFRRVLVEAYDAAGGSSFQYFNLEVRSPNIAPEFTSLPTASGVAGAILLFDIDVADADAVNFTLLAGPTGATLDPRTGLLVWRTTAADLGTHEIVVRATDERGLSTDTTVQAVLVADTQAPEVRLGLSQNLANPGDDITIGFSAIDNVGVTLISLEIDGTAVVTTDGVFTYRAAHGGLVNVTAYAVDAAGNLGRADAQIRVFDPADIDRPVIEITAPQPGSVVTYLTEIVGSVTDANLEFYRLEYSLAGMNQWHAFAAGNTNVTNGLLGVFDPTMLENDIYDVRVVAQDVNGLITTLQLPISLDGRAKLGEFKLEFTDLMLPGIGLPLTVSRTYSTLQADRQGDFGYGWTLSMQDARIRETVPVQPGEETLGTLAARPFRPGERIYLTAPDGRRLGFTFEPVQDVVTFFGLFWRPHFVADPGVNETLEVDNITLSYGDDGVFRMFGFGVPYNPSEYTLVTKDGVRWTYDQFEGLRRVEDRNGNTLTFTDAGIFASNGTSVQFVRDDQNRITEIIDPEGNSLHYTYDADGNLVKFEDQIGTKTSYFYDDAARPHYLTELTNPGCGCRFDTYLRTEFDDAGRLIAQYDAAGNPIEMEYDLENFTEVVRDRLGNETVMTFDDRGNVTAAQNALGNVFTFVYDSQDRVVSQIDPRGFVTTQEYDARGNVVRHIDATGGITESAYDRWNNVVSSVDVLGRRSEYEYDERGNLLRAVDAAGEVARLEYDSTGRPTALVNRVGSATYFEYGNSSAPTAMVRPGGVRFEIEYDAFGMPIRTVDEIGQVRELRYDAAGNLTRMIEPDGSFVELAGDGETVTAITDRLGRTTRFTYDAQNRLTESLDPAGGVTRYEYDANGRVIAVIDPIGRTQGTRYDALGRVAATFVLAGPDDTDVLQRIETTFTYDAVGNLTATVDALGRTTTYSYDSLDRLTQITDALGQTATFAYDAAGRLLSETDVRGFSTTYAYDVLDRLLSVTDPLGQATRYEYDAVGNLTARVDARDFRTEFGYDALNRHVTTVDPLGGIETVEYDARGLRTAVTDARGATTRFGYDSRGQWNSQTDAAGGVWQFNRDAEGNLLQFVDPLGRTTEYAYDALDRVVRMVDAAGNESTSSYDAAGRLTAETDALGRTTEYGWNLLDLPTLVVDPLGAARRFSYDAVGNLTALADANDQSTQFRYDALNRLVERIDAAGATNAFAYDAAGNLTTATDALGRTTQYRYDDLDRLTETEDALGAVIARGYDAVGNLTAYVDPLGNRTEYRFDGLNRVIEEIDPLLHSRVFAYDAVGNLTEYVDRNGRSTTFDYDGLNRIVGETWHSESGTESNRLDFTYDAVGNLLSAADAFSRYTFAYDDLDRLVTEDNAGSPNMLHVVLTHTYDAVGNRVNVLDNLGVNVASTYTVRDQLESRTWTGLPGGAEAAIEFEYDAAGRTAAIERFADAGRTQIVGSTVFDYDELSRLTSISHRDPLDEVLANYVYERNAADELTAWTHHGERIEYVHDATGQLLSADGTSTPDEAYTYDSNGNRVSGTTVIGPGNRLLADVRFEYAYDAEGNLSTQTDRATGEVTVFTYDHRNRLTLVEIRSAGGIVLSEASFTYDVFDRRLSETVDEDGAGAQAARTTRFVYDGENVWADFDATGAVAARYLFGDGSDELLARWRAQDGAAWYLTDHLGTVRDIVDHTGGLLNHIDYDSFGRILSEANAAAGDRYKFTGREYVASLGLYYYRARFYDPVNGRFLSTDPLSFAAGDANLYRYVGNRPLTYRDPFGRMAITEVGPIHKENAKKATAWQAAIEAGRKSVNECIKNQLKQPGIWIALLGPGGPALWHGIMANCLRQGVAVVGLDFAAAVINDFLGKLPQDFGNPPAQVPGANNPPQQLPGGGEALPGANGPAGGQGGAGLGGNDLDGGAGANPLPTPEGNPPAPTPVEELTAAAERARSQVGAGQGAPHGTRVHKAFEDEVNGLGNTNFRTEISYLNGRQVNRGTPGSVRLDVVQSSGGVPEVVYDLKTGGARLTPARVEKIQSHLPNGQNVPVIEIR